jgi:glycosyltransferase involved in cell wall biosynthesis
MTLPIQASDNGHPAIDILISDFTYFGAQRIAVIAANGLASRGYKVRFVVLRDEGPFSSHLSAGIERLELLASDLWTPPPHTQLLTAAYRYRRACRNDRERIVISFSPVTNALALAATLGKSSQHCVLQEHAHQGVAIEDSTSYSRQFTLFYKKLLARSYRFADHLIFVSDSARQYLVTQYRLPASKASTIYNPIDMNSVGILGEGATPEWPPAGGLRIIAVGRLAPQKNFHRFLSVLARLRDRAPHFDFDAAILGDGPDRDSLLTRVKELGLEERVRFIGFQENHYPYIRSADVICLTSEWEGLPYVLAEAMTLKTVVVAHDCPSGPSEMIRAEAGILTPFADIDAMAQALEALGDETLRSRMSVRGLEVCQELYDTNTYLNKCEEIFASILV